MAYIVGSASVEIVPDFRQAQLAITAWFAKQQNELRVPVRPDISQETTRLVEKQAQDTGNRVGKAISDGVERSTNRNMLSPLARQITKLEADIEKQQTRTKETTDALRVAQLRLEEARRAGNRSASSMLALENAVERAQNRVNETSRNSVRLTEQLRDARRQLELETVAAAKQSAEAVAEATRKETEARETELRRSQERIGAALAKDIEKAIALRKKEFDDQVKLGEQMAREIERNLDQRRKARERDAALSLQETMRSIEREVSEKMKARERSAKDAEKYAEREARASLKALDDAIREGNREKIQIEIDKRQAILEGRTTGGLVARAIHQEVRQNAGLITAAVTGALLVGGPLISSAAVGMFGAIGAAGAFQSNQLRSTWVGTFEEIKTNGIADTAALIPAFERMAGSIGNSFERMRPQLRGIFEELPDQIDIFSVSLAQATENMIPGFLRAIQSGRPIVSGFGDLLEQTGTGLTDFLDNITDRAPAAGQSLGYLGGTMGELLPLLGELLGEGAELGTIVLPVLNASLGGMRTVVESLGGSLPMLATGFLAFRTIQGSARFVTQLSQALLNVAPNLGVFTERMTGSAAAGERVMSGTSRAAGAVASFGRALPAVGVAVGGVAMIMADAKMEIDGFANAFITGGAAAAKARNDLADEGAWTTIKTGIAGIFDADMWQGASTAELRMKNTREAVQELEASMSPLELAQSRLAYWTNELAYRMDDESASAEDVAIAQRKVAEYSARTTAEQEKLERATRGVTEAMVEQADQARARVDSEYGYQQAVLDTQDASMKVAEAQKALNEARAGGNADEIAAAEMGLKQALLDSNSALGAQVDMAKERAMSNLPAALDDEQKAILGYKAAYDELNAIMALGIPLPPELEQYRQYLGGIIEQADGAKLAQAQLVAAIGEVGFAVSAIPGTKTVKIEAPTDELITRLKDLGFQVNELPDGSIEVKAVTEEAKGNLGNLSALLTNLDGTIATPGVEVQGTAQTSEEVNRNTRELQILGGQRPNPVVDMDNQPFNGKRDGVMADILNMGRQRPTPTVDGDPHPFQGVFAGVMSQLGIVASQRPNPTITATDWASNVARGVKSAIDSIVDKTVVITSINRVVNQVVNQFPSLTGWNNAVGGAVEDIPRRNALHPVYKFGMGGAIVGRGSAKDDLVPAFGPNPFAQYRVANGEHILDGLDVALLGGQAGVYAFRDMLKAGAFQSPQQDTGIRSMVATAPVQQQAASAPSTPPRAVHLYTPDVPAAIRELKAQEHQDAVLASPW